MNLELLVVFLDEPALVIPGHLNFGPRRMFPKMFLAKLRVQKLFLQLKKETKVAPPEDPEVVPPTQEEGDQSKVAPSEVPEVVPPAPRDEPKISSSMRRVAFSRVFGREKIH